MLRNRGFFRAVVAWMVLACSLMVLATCTGHAEACAWIAAAALATALPFLALTVSRYRAIARLSERVDAVLHGERSVDLEHMEEGELAVLTSELDKMVTRLNLTADELERERQTLADALADISHQLKTPLTSLSLSTELVRRSLVDEGGHASEVERLRKMQRLQQRVERLVSTLLKLARIDAGVVHLRTAPVDVEHLVQDAFEPLAIAFDIADVTFSARVTPGTTFIGDAGWTAEALSNILKNCMEHTPAGGTVQVRATEDTIACRMVIEDTGGGIAPHDLAHIFERFYRGEAAEGAGRVSSDVDPAGVGIGLSLARGLITAQGGTLTAENVQDAEGRTTGARFTITFFKTNV
ncbi:HAMP domain-containing sensor histidine kinase [Collinsella sp. An2]|uniref:sensor histidine kinase n=1 Tax=Collinsella sp. An2 TaxID=1965585 RepID=UPI000B367267|nr:HAMP domain-containing sensor histidine kinase [Collinsella sp. An2]OUP10091.1 two-component sensor histidine kinase [Collinsella sp. An2]